MDSASEKVMLIRFLLYTVPKGYQYDQYGALHNPLSKAVRNEVKLATYGNMACRTRDFSLVFHRNKMQRELASI